MSQPNLRHLKKEATAKALAETAFELALEHGLDGFVVEDVANKAGYSRRTFANYFSCKEEAVAMGAITFRDTDEVEHLLAGVPEDASLLDILYQLIRMQLTAEYLRKMRDLVRLCREHPSLEPYFLSVVRRSQTEAQELLLELSKGRHDEAYTHLLTGALYGAMLPIVDGSLNVLLPWESTRDRPGATSFEQFLETAYGYLRNGF